MTPKGISHDAGRVLGMNWRPVFDPDVVDREQRGLHRVAA